MIETWFLLMIWAANRDGVAAPTMVPFQSEAACRVVGEGYGKPPTRINPTSLAHPNVWLLDWRCVKAGNQ